MKMEQHYKYGCGCRLESWNDGYVRTYFCLDHEKRDVEYPCGCKVDMYQKDCGHIRLCNTHKPPKHIPTCPWCGKDLNIVKAVSLK